MPRPACTASRWAASYRPREYCGQSSASPLRTSHSPRSAPPTEHVATVRRYRSSEIGMQLTGRLAMKASRSFAAFAPQRYCRLSSPRQSWLLSGASIPHRRMRVPWMSSVSPSMTLARPARSSANALGIDATISAANAAVIVLIMLPPRGPPCPYPAQQSSSPCPATAAAAPLPHPTVRDADFALQNVRRNNRDVKSESVLHLGGRLVLGVDVQNISVAIDWAHPSQ